MSPIFCACAMGLTGVTFTSRPLTRSGISIRPRSSITYKIRDISGTIVSVIKRPNAEPRFCASSFMRSAISVADRADMLSGGSVSSSKIFLTFMRRSLITICDTLKSPERGIWRRLSPCGPPLRATGIMAPGWMRMFCGFNTPSSAAV